MLATRTLVHLALTQFQSQPDFRTAATNLFKELGYQSSRTVRLAPATAAGFVAHFGLTADEFDPAKAHTGEWVQFEFLFQFGDAEVKRPAAGNPALELFNQETDRGNKNSFFFHAVRLTGESYRRGILADITRQLNRPFGLPTVVLFQHGATFSLGVINRRPNKKDATREVLEKVTLIKDISLAAPHPAHVRILDELRLSEQVRLNKVTNFDTLLHGWQVTLSISELNKRFYRELANWYFWAVREVKLPAYPGDQGADVRHATAMIRLITRVIFTWFLKEKHLVPAGLFDKDFVYGELLPPPVIDDRADEGDEKATSTYYKAVLQNLFFATLNTEMRDADNLPNRRFLPPSNARNQNVSYGEAGYLRYQDLFTKTGQTRMLDLVNQIPFLNGGLFECLDPTPPKAAQGQPRPERVLIDCFSNGNQHLLHVPDKLFFADAHTLDLSAEYGEKTRKKETVRGLLPLLNRYKFTIAENTPLEEEVALDPELLGKVFENLLAAYNPETQTTARKQTGSFYTPREVVEYMVDESLLAYLRPHLPSGPAPAPRLAQTNDQPSANLFGEIKPEQATLSLAPAKKLGSFPESSGSPFLLEKGPGDEVNAEDAAATPEAALRNLLAHPEAPNPFDKAATWKLIQALDALKLLDPACGSGAFPMGALQRLTYLLARLDPNNKLWKQQQLDRAEADRQTSRGFMDEKLRQQAADAADRRIGEIKNAFNTNNHELDYARKLYLIENCLYGVDIQPVAVQITKLRCFIALLVEQKADGELARQPEHNLGIRPLPNLETKFVAANTLLRLEEEAPAAGRQVGLLAMDDEVLTLRQTLREVRHEYFTVRGRSAKLRLRAQDADLRARLGKALERSGMPAKDAVHLAEWNPYDLKLAADFFSPKWMLGVDDGFDVVIGNPPYVRQEKLTALKPVLQKLYPASYDGKADLCVYFYDRSLQLLCPGGVLSFITQNKFFMSGYGQKLRTMLTNTTSLEHLLDFGDAPVFDALAYPTIILTQKRAPATGHRLQAMIWRPGPAIEGFAEIFRAQAASLPQKALAIDGWRLDDTSDTPLLVRLRSKGKTLDNFIAGGAYYGMKPGSAKFFIDDETRAALIKQDFRSAEIIKPVLMGRDLKPYGKATAGRHLLFTRRGIDMKKYPAVLKYLQPFKEELLPKPRDWEEGEWLGRKEGTYAWYELQDAVDYYQMFDRPKIMYQKFQVKPCFIYDESGLYCNDSMWILPNASKYLLGLLNSRMGWYLISQFCTRIQNGYQLIYQYLRQIPIATPTAAQEKQIETLVNQILAAKAASATADTSVLERQVDALVYALYDLTKEEIALVEGRSA